MSMSEYEDWTVPSCRLGESEAEWTPSSVLWVQGQPSYILGQVCYADLVVIGHELLGGCGNIQFLDYDGGHIYVYIHVHSDIHSWICVCVWKFIKLCPLHMSSSSIEL